MLFSYLSEKDPLVAAEDCIKRHLNQDVISTSSTSASALLAWTEVTGVVINIQF